MRGTTHNTFRLTNHVAHTAIRYEYQNADITGIFSTHLSFIEHETPELLGRETTLKIVGVSFYQENLRRAHRQYGETTVILERNPDNPHDKHAVAVKTLAGNQLGWIGREENGGEHPGRFWCPRLLGEATILRLEERNRTTNLSRFLPESRFNIDFYGTVQGRFDTSSMLPGTLAALPFELPMNLIASCRALSETLDKINPKEWVRLKTDLLERSRAASKRQSKDDDDDFPRCCMSGLPCDTLEPLWRLETASKTIVLEHFVVCHRAMKDVLYVDPSEPEPTAIDRLVRMNFNLLTVREATNLYRRTLETCRRRGSENWTLRADPGLQFCLTKGGKARG